MSSLAEAGVQVEVSSTKTAAPCGMSRVSVGEGGSMSSLAEAGPQVEVSSTKTAAPCGMLSVNVGDERGSPAHHSKNGLGTEPEPEDLWRVRTHAEVSAFIRALHGCQPVCVCLCLCVQRATLCSQKAFHITGTVYNSP